jgi:Na+-translocating ferredoxin:NAD+ oxidoreductase RnfC subunit
MELEDDSLDVMLSPKKKLMLAQVLSEEKTIIMKETAQAAKLVNDKAVCEAHTVRLISETALNTAQVSKLSKDAALQKAKFCLDAMQAASFPNLPSAVQEQLTLAYMKAMVDL